MGVTCDNAANNDVMIAELSQLVPMFAGAASQTRCFLHVVNLIAKSVLRQFDVKSMKTKDTKLDEEIKDEELEMLSESGQTEGDNSEENFDLEDSDDGYVDEQEALSAEELEKLESTTQPVRTALSKVIQY